MRPISCVMLLAALGACTNETEVTQPGEAATHLQANVQYQVVKYPILGGSLSRGMAISNNGVAAGWSVQTDGTRRAVLWPNGTTIKPLGTLGGPSSTVPWPGLNEVGMVVGISQTGLVDPLDEDWSCEFAGFLTEVTNLICRGFVWQNNAMHELPPLGGYHSFAAGVNNQGQVVGWAETAVHDPTCSPTTRQVLQFRAVRYELKKGVVTAAQLKPLPGDSTSAATAINEAGTAVGISGPCDQAVGRYSAIHSVMWDKSGRVSEIPHLGGVTWHTPMDINQRGDVAGFSNPAGVVPEDDFEPHAFLWINGTNAAVDLQTLPGDLFSQAFAINQDGVVVGVSFGGANGSHAFIYENGQMTDLNSILGTGNGDIFRSAQDINDAGQITGRVFDAATGKTVPFVATPIP
jgi:probable HAF family extracellular repeat protein